MENSPTALFESYEQDFQDFLKTIKEKLGDENASREQQTASIRRVEMELDEADEMVSQMEIEIQGIPQSIRPQYLARLKSAKSDLSHYKKRSKEIHSQLSRADLLSQSGAFATSDEPYGASNDRTRLLAGTSLLEEGTKRLQDSHRIALETEEQGAGILLNLRSQREQIEHSRDTLRVADASIDRASGTLKKMIRRMYKQRALTAAIIIVLLLLIAIILWEKLS